MPSRRRTATRKPAPATAPPDAPTARPGPASATSFGTLLLQALIAHLDDGVLAETADGRVLVANPAFRRIFAIAGDEADSGGSLAPRVRQALATPDGWPPSGEATEPGVPLVLQLTDGRTLEHRYAPLAPGGRQVHMWQFRDVTARRRAEDELIASQHRVRELSAHLEGVREEERRTLARELHDELGQLLTGIRLEVASAVEKFQDAQTSTAVEVVDRLQGAVGLVDLSIATVRRITSALRPAMLDHLGLIAAIRWEAGLFERRTGIRCRVTTRPAGFETHDHVTVAYRILLEALTNVSRHAHAGTVWIRVAQRLRSLTLEVRDNGKGINPDVLANPTTLGLLGMRERALAAGGDVRISRVRTGGTRVLVTLPLKQKSEGRRVAADA